MGQKSPGEGVLRVGVLNPSRGVGHGGYFHYLKALTEGLSQYEDMSVFVFCDDTRSISPDLNRPNLSWVNLKQDESGFARMVRTASTLANVRSPLVGRFEALRERELDCLVSCSSPVGFHLGIPFVGIVFDFIYRYYPRLADFGFKERMIRNMVNGRLVKHASLLVTDSEMGRRDLVKFFGADPARTRPIPLSPSPHVYQHRDLPEQTLREVATRYGLPERFIFYPAQLWEHKNHGRLFEALARLRDVEGVRVPCVLAGSGGDHAESVLAAIPEFGLEGQVLHLGYVPDEDLAALYILSEALVYASFAEYTNMPVLEAMVLGTPVVCSDAFAMPEQIGRAGLLFDPFDVQDIAKKILSVWTDGSLRERLIREGTARAEERSLRSFGKHWYEAIRAAVSAEDTGEISIGDCPPPVGHHRS